MSFLESNKIPKINPVFPPQKQFVAALSTQTSDEKKSFNFHSIHPSALRPTGKKEPTSFAFNFPALKAAISALIKIFLPCWKNCRRVLSQAPHYNICPLLSNFPTGMRRRRRLCWHR